jgi:hypothetical protein
LSTSTTTDRFRIIRAFAANSALLLASWFALVLLVTPLLPPGLPLAALMPATARLDELPPDARIMDWQSGRIHLISDHRGLALELYRHGAWLVIPLGNASCLGIARATIEKASEVAQEHAGARRADRGRE